MKTLTEYVTKTASIIIAMLVITFIASAIGFLLVIGSIIR